MKIEEKLKEISNHQAAFSTFPLRDKNPLGRTEKLRMISAPNEAMRKAHRSLIALLRGLNIDLTSATAMQPGCSPLKNAAQHRHNRYFYITDIHDAYQHVDIRILAAILCDLDEEEIDRTPPPPPAKLDAIHAFLRCFCCNKGKGLAMGGPASPDLFNIYCAALIDPPLRKLAATYGLTYTRYLDDLTFSGDDPIGWRKRRALNEVIRGAGFTLSDRKTRVLDLEKKSIEINGVGLEIGGRIFLPRRYARMLNGLLRCAMKDPEPLAPVTNGKMSAFHAVYKNAPIITSLERRLARNHGKFKRRVRSARSEKINATRHAERTAQDRMRMFKDTNEPLPPYDPEDPEAFIF